MKIRPFDKMKYATSMPTIHRTSLERNAPWVSDDDFRCENVMILSLNTSRMGEVEKGEEGGSL